MRILFIIFISILVSCNPSSKGKQTKPTGDSDTLAAAVAGPPALVYKTRGDYYRFVPVLLSEDKSRIISYPHPGDLKTGKGYRYPDSLSGGYLLDNKGIGPHVAFLGITYEEYSDLSEVPDADSLYAKIIDKDPLTELCNCGLRMSFSDPVLQLNRLIDSSILRTNCKVIK
jgi:hypothetical protein